MWRDISCSKRHSTWEAQGLCGIFALRCVLLLGMGFSCSPTCILLCQYRYQLSLLTLLWPIAPSPSAFPSLACQKLGGFCRNSSNVDGTVHCFGCRCTFDVGNIARGNGRWWQPMKKMQRMHEKSTTASSTPDTKSCWKKEKSWFLGPI